MALKEILDKVKFGFNNSAKAWNKGLTVNYTIFTTEKYNTIYQWEITNVTQDEVRLPRETLNGVKDLISFT